jgi:branched-chain amino acid transport system ATP-binding protein
LERDKHLDSGSVAPYQEARPASMNGQVPLLQVTGLSTGYARKQVLYDISVDVHPGEIVAVLGHNGAGKTTLLKAIFGYLPPTSGTVHFSGKDRTREAYWAKVKDGITYSAAEAPVFRDLSISDNLELGGFTVGDPEVRAARMERVYQLFPILGERRRQLAGTLSGGQQRMLSLGMAVVAGPKLMLLDEPSLGLSPAIVQSIFDQVAGFAQEDGLSVLLVEQNVKAALRIANRAYFMRAGHIILEEDSESALARGHWWDLF